MQLPFSAEQFFDVFRAYNTTVWPAQVLLLVLALVAVVLVFVSQRWSSMAISAILGGVVAHNTSLQDLQSRVKEDPFVVENVVATEIVEIAPSRAHARLQFLLEQNT